MKKQLIILGTVVVLVFLCLSGCSDTTKPLHGPFYVGYGSDADFQSIQDAIDAAQNGTTIFIQNGSYNEVIVIDKTITLIGENKNTTILNFSPDYQVKTQVPIINITADNCTIENLQITLSNKSNFQITETYSGGCCGGRESNTEYRSLYSGGISIYSKNNTIKNNIIINVSEGIQLLGFSELNTIIYNEIKNNQIGIGTLNSIHNTISRNILSNNQQYNIYLSTDSDSNQISYNILDTSIWGIRITGSQLNTVYQNCINNNDIGIYCCCNSILNYIYSNNFINNFFKNAEEDKGLTNIWYNYSNHIGNYWDNYSGSDENHDGIGDTPFEIYNGGNQDIFPLMIPPKDSPCNQ